MTTSELERLRELAGREHVQGEGLAREYAIEGRSPRAIVEPGSVDALSGVLAIAREQGWAVVFWGGGTQMGRGNAPTRYDLAITTRRLNQVLDYQPDDMTVTLQGGVILDNLARVLAERGQFLPLDPPVPQRATAGGTIAAAATGPLRAAYGRPRDYLIGARIIDAGGEAVAPGGRVVKNVTGYDLCKLYTGSLGTLGALAELTFKVLPKPVTWMYSAIGVNEAEQAEALTAGVHGSDAAPAAFELVNAPVWEKVASASLSPMRFLILAVFAGVPDAVAWQQAELERIAGGLRLRAYSLDPLKTEVWFRAIRDYPARAGLVLDLSTRSSETAMAAQSVEDIAVQVGLRVDLVGHATSGGLMVRFPDPGANPLPELVAAVRGVATAVGGSAVVARVPDGGGVGAERWGQPPAGFPLMRGIKKALDPAGILAPGRFVGGI